mgnify:CR=1 FL=1
MAEPFIGEVRIFAGNFAPRGWAFCDGQLLPISQNTALFSLLGTTNGGDGRSTFALPDLKGRAAMHPGSGPGLTSRSLGQKEGVESVTLTGTQIPSHNHSLNVSNSNGTTTDPADSVFATMPDSTLVYTATSPDGELQASTLANVGSGQSHENMQPYLALNFIIALIGIYPSRG